MDLSTFSLKLKKSDEGIWLTDTTSSVSYPDDGNEACFQIEENSFWFKHRMNCITTLIKIAPPHQNGAIFDIGGGNGFVSLALQNAGHETVLLEPGNSGAFNAKKRGVKNVICSTLSSAQISKNSIPAIGIFDVIEHIEDDLSFLKEINHALAINGKLYLTVPAYPLLWSYDDVEAGHYRRYTQQKISRLVRKAGFEINYSSYFFHFLPLPIFILRTLPSLLKISKRSNKNQKAAIDHSVQNSLIDKLLNKLMSFEIKRMAKKKRIPFGGSCLLAATKIKTI